MSSLASFCNVPVSARFDAHSATCCVSLDWVVNSGLRTHNSRISGPLTLPCNVGVMSMILNDVPVTVSLAPDLVLGLNWLNFVRSSAPDLVLHLGSGLSLDVQRPPIPAIGVSESGSPMSSAVAPPSPSVSLGGPGAVSASSSPGRPVRGVSKHLVREVPHPVREVS
ncbi:hypothetical protein B0H11DRAFT_2273676 [Mycena galericulata]|nr:hypothetical protein B0H11DRAFT_2273676 [Mycena galericulata]